MHWPQRRRAWRSRITRSAGIADRLGVADAFTEGHTTAMARTHLQQVAHRSATSCRSSKSFWARGGIELPFPADNRTMFEQYRPTRCRTLKTPSGRIELASEVIAGFGYDDRPGHPTWIEPDDGARRATPLHLIANQPSTRLHGQLDVWRPASTARCATASRS
jgi:biotin/methionine sulfoxide reductase